MQALLPVGSLYFNKMLNKKLCTMSVKLYEEKYTGKRLPGVTVLEGEWAAVADGPETRLGHCG